MNSITVIGRLGRDAEMRYTTSGTAVCNFSIAVDRRGKDREGEKLQPLWLKVILWAKQAETLNKFLLKGKQVGIQGELDVREFDRKDGTKGTSVEIVARQVTLLGGRTEGTQEEIEEAPKQEVPVDEDVF